MSSIITFNKRKLDYSDKNFTHTISSAESIQYNSFGQIISRARLEKKPLIIVEGFDDVPIYESLALSNNINISVRAVETFSGYSEGCEGVKKFIQAAQFEIDKSLENERYILGIVDRDATVFRGESLSELKCLFTLEVYSIETHFVTREHARYVLENMLNSHSMINEHIIEFVAPENLHSIFQELYYISLESLKNACDIRYSGILGYKYSFGRIKNSYADIQQILEKRNELDEFATSLELSMDHSYRQVIKGKWLLESFIENIYIKAQELMEKCIKDEVIMGQQRCQFCNSGILNKCSWKLKKSYSKDIIHNVILQHHSESEVGYIKDRLRKLG
ncbi:hypothetical protein ABIE27_004154 [Paenibacillus sp. 4624]|uniref:hypothetical protein n=1 Tax=Paenibacillus sp. 4624 TaxID=3156453 RepID=UPI003D2527BB